jgi:hypothetical protein
MSFAETRGDVTGAQVAISVPERGRFSFSSQPLPGYRMDAVVDRDRLLFIDGNDAFDVQCHSPLLEPSGSWYLWVRREPLEGSPPHLYPGTFIAQTKTFATMNGRWNVVFDVAASVRRDGRSEQARISCHSCCVAH